MCEIETPPLMTRQSDRTLIDGSISKVYRSKYQAGDDVFQRNKPE